MSIRKQQFTSVIDLVSEDECIASQIGLTSHWQSFSPMLWSPNCALSNINDADGMRPADLFHLVR
jgi:hypothetical protein